MYAGCSTNWSRRTSSWPGAPARSRRAGCGSYRPRTPSSHLAGLFVTFEGPEGAGKSTQVARLQERLGDRDVGVHREPGSTRLGDRVRELLLNGAAMNPEAEMFLFMAARAELVGERILPALDRG